jgi:hypothetical protein
MTGGFFVVHGPYKEWNVIASRSLAKQSDIPREILVTRLSRTLGFRNESKNVLPSGIQKAELRRPNDLTTP